MKIVIAHQSAQLCAEKIIEINSGEGGSPFLQAKTHWARVRLIEAIKSGEIDGLEPEVDTDGQEKTEKGEDADDTARQGEEEHKADEADETKEESKEESKEEESREDKKKN